MNLFVQAKRQRLLLLVIALTLPLGPTIQAAEEAKPLYACVFTRNGWNAKDWIFVRRRDMKNRDEWIQNEDSIANPDTTPDGHTSMLYAQKLKGDMTVTATVAFADRMAPSIMLASKLVDDAAGRKEFDENLEVVLWEQGINVWTHRTEDGKDIFKLTAFLRQPMEKNKKYTLQVTKKGKELSITVAGSTFGYVEESLTDEYYVGVTGEEGPCRFYDFALRR